MNIAPQDAPCKDIKVIEFATMVSGPLAGQMLADLGAEVIKIEPLSGDPLRAMRPHSNGLPAYFHQMNRSKKSLALDLKTADGLKTAKLLIKNADVVLENFKPGTMEKIGLGYDELCEDNPGLIFATINGFGAEGPYANRPAYDHVIQGLSGVMQQFGKFADTGKPAPIHNPIADKLAATTLTQGILAALLSRERNGGIGQTVSVSLLDAYATFMLHEQMANHTFQLEGREQIDDVKLHFPIETSDGYVIGHVQLDPQFHALCRICGREELIDDPRFKDPWSRISRYGEMWEEIQKGTRNFTTKELVEKAAEKNVPLAPVNSIEDFFEDPQVLHSQTWFDTEDDECGTIRNLKYPVEFGVSQIDTQHRGPLLNEHGDKILSSLGQSNQDSSDD
tara:strand:+ start:22847 stop:24025 length:1179 start_codon:yes stop_codon:yes gene_type:complete